MRKVPAPNHTQSPNVFYDEWIKEISSLAELKVVEVVIRGTFGWHRERVKMSLTGIQEATGLSKSSTQDGVKRALKDGYIERVKDGRSFSYEISSDVPESGTTNLHDIPKSGTEMYREPVRSPVESLLEKETTKENKTSRALRAAVVADTKRLMGFLEGKIGPRQDAKGQAAAAKWLAEHYTVEQCQACWEYLAADPAEHWRKATVTWHTVVKEIGNWMARRNGSLPNRSAVVDSSKTGQTLAAGQRVMDELLKERDERNRRQA